MEKKTIILELPCELIEKIDRMNTLGDRSAFVAHLLEEQIKKREEFSTMKTSTQIPSKMEELSGSIRTHGEVRLVKNDGTLVGTFNIDTIEGFESLAKKIQEVSEDPIVRIKARRLL